MIRVAIVNDLPLAVEALRRTLAAAPWCQVAWVAADGAEAVRKCEGDTPDVVLMDLIMPVMDGVVATREIMRRCPCAVLVVTATVTGNAGRVFEAMGHGALDAVSTPELGVNGALAGGEELLRKIAVVAKLIRKPVEPPVLAASAPRAACPVVVPELAVIGASTGGPKALAEILGAMPADPGCALAVVQHVDARFASGLADWLDQQCALRVEVAREGQRLAPGVVLVAGTNDHLVLGPDLALHYTPEPRDYPYRPSVDAFFSSLALHWPRPGVAALLTGMGRDGAKGLLELRGKGFHTIAQDEATSVVYGMPKAAAELGAAEAVLPLPLIAQAILARIKERYPHVP
ncbi:chemotaxis response regulator protein-glutamate methylesterase [Desulfolutivibrio sulfoxidireducens]|uniref:chemotaxis response regulator protein-glutamate methylesterase n=1 Tax=Desulfolutivibrio sulfoxidireducens TaxID=2773299 RepID=UPI0023DDEB88|nr:chemotaxis response regulator protein-glutamate methylesterase [Desulfolutivibrio sulfoxidireducens]